MKKEKLISLFKEILNENLLEITPSGASEAGNLFRRLGNTIKSGSKAETVAKDIVNTMNLGGAKGEAINIFGKLTKDSKGKTKFTETGNPLPVTSGEELLFALKNGKIDAENLARVNKGILKSPNATRDMIDDIVGDVIIQPQFIEKYGKTFSTKGEEQVRTLLKDNGYSQVAIESIIKRMKVTPDYGKNVANIEKNLKRAQDKSKALDAKVKDLEAQIKNQANTTIIVTKSEAVKNIDSTVKQAEQDVAQVMNTNKSRLRNMTETAFKKFNLVKKSLAARWLVSLGIVGAGAYFIDKSLFGGTTKPDGTNTIHPKCITDLLDDDGASVGVTSSGDPVVVVKKTGNSDYDKAGGLMFYTNGRVISVDNKMRGNWSCNGNSLSVNEDININEQISDETMDSDVNKMINLLDFPVTGSNLQDAVKLLTKYANSSRGKEFLDLYRDSGYGSGDLKKSLDYIFTSEPSSVRAKRTLYDLVSKIEGGKTGGDSNKSTGIGNINIVWDGSKKNTNTNTGSNTGTNTSTNTNKKTKKSRYKDCSSFPFEFGCRSPLIGEIQKCIGVSPSHGNFGPWTLKALEDLKIDTSNGITDLIYNTIMNSCGEIDSSLTQTKTPEPSQTPQTPMTLSSLVDEPKKSETTPSVTPRDANKFYTDLANSGYIAKVEGDDDKNRIKYKGPDLNNEDLTLLDTAMSEKGYDRIKQVDKKYGSKYVYLKRD